MCPRCCFKEIIPKLEVKIRINPSSLARSLFTVYAFGRATFIEIAVCIQLCITAGLCNDLVFFIIILNFFTINHDQRPEQPFRPLN